MSLFKTRGVPILFSALLMMIATNAAIASELCFVQSLGYVYYCPPEKDIPGEGAEGFSTPDVDPCPKLPGAATRLTISASDTNPYLTRAPLPPSQTSLYLWHVTNFPLQAELSHLFCDVVGDLPVIGFDSGFEHDLSAHPNGNQWSLYLNAQCLVGFGSNQVLLGEFQLESPTPVNAESWARIKAIYR